MEVFFKKIIGWILLIAGVWFIGWGLFSAYKIFNGTKDVPQLFKFESQPVVCNCPLVSAPKTQAEQQLKNMQEEVQKLVEGQMKEQIKNIIPPEFISKILNLASWSIFLGILIFAGSQIAGVGIKLLRL